MTPTNRMHLKILIFLLGLFMAFASQANDDLSIVQTGSQIQEVRNLLIKRGWSPIKNLKIANSSLYGQEIYEQGLIEVKDCISMELDACWFEYTNKNQILKIKTTTRLLKIDSYQTIKKR
jgi:hypothetical protein